MSLEAFPIIAQTVQTQNLVDLSLSGNTSGALALMSSGTVTIAGGNNITLSQAGNAFTISAFNQSVQTQNNVDVTLSGNTSGALALISSGTLTLAGGNNITLSQAGNAVTISAANTSSQSVQTQNCVDVTLAGNTSGALALVSSGTLTLAGGNNITLSQAGNAVTISAGSNAAPNLSFFDNMMGGSTDFFGSTNNTLHFFPIHFNGVFPGNMTVSTARLHLSCNMSVTNASTQAHTYTVFLGIYTVNASTLSLFNSASTSFGTGAANASISSQYHGIRFLTYNSSLFSNSSLSLSGGVNYVGALLMRSSGTNHAFRFIASSIGDFTGQSGTIGTTGNTSQMKWNWGGFGMSSSTGGLPASIAFTDVLGFSALANYCPHVLFDNFLSSY